jgi:hypothetical protein
MRHAPLLLGAILIFTLDLHAQVNPSYSLPEVSVSPAAISSPSLMNPPGAGLFALANTTPSAFAAAEPAADPQPQQGPLGVFRNYSWGFYGGYSFFRFYISSKPEAVSNMNGLDFGVVYYPHAGWIGIEGQGVFVFGSYLGDSSFALLSGGARFRWSAPRDAEVWGHALVGYSKFIPQTAMGGQNAFGFEAGAGVDLGSHRKRFAIRFEGDLVGTRYFSTYQFSPRFAAGIIYKY